MKLVDEIVKSRLSLVKTRVEFSIELYRCIEMLETITLHRDQ